MWEAHYIGDSVVDGATLDWEHYERFQDMSEDSIANLTLQDYEKYEEQRMEKNAWRFASQLAQRIDGAPVLSDYRTFTQAFQNVQKTLFFNGEYQEVMSSCEYLYFRVHEKIS